MVPGVIGLRCPACTHPFLCPPQQAGTLVGCPHCQFTAAIETYASTAAEEMTPPATPAAAMPRRSHRFHPVSASQVPLPGNAYEAQASPSQPVTTPPAARNSAPFVPANFQPFTPQQDGVAYQSPSPSPWRPRRNKRSFFFLALIGLLMLVCGGLVWTLSHPHPPATEEEKSTAPVAAIQSPAPALTSLAQPPSASAQSPELDSPAVAGLEVRKVGLPTAPAESVPAPEAIPLVLPNEAPEPAELDLLAASEAAIKLTDTLFSTGKTSAKLSVLAQGEEHQAAVEAFFAKHPTLKKSRVKSAEASPLTLPGQEATALFGLTTEEKGRSLQALFRLVAQPAGRFLLHWPLLEESHEGRLATFLKKPPGEPAWFHVVLRRSHGLDLPEQSRKEHLCMELQAGAPTADRPLALASLDTPLGRFLERETVWGQFYVGRLLLQTRATEDQLVRLVILDCEGAVMGAAFPSGSAK